MSAGRWVFDQAQDPGFFPPVVRPKALQVGPQIQATFAKAYKAGVKILFGTDTGVEQTRRQRARVQAHGRWRHAADGGHPRRHQSAPAKFLDLDDKVGSIAVGKLGELVGVPGNPLDDITVMERVVFVMKDDTVYKAP